MKKILLLVFVLAAGPMLSLAQPTITQPPTNQVLVVGGTLTLGVTASGSALAYQWFKDSRWISGATNSTLAVPNAGVTNSGMYYVVVTNSGGMIISLPASVAVGDPTLLAWGDNQYGELGNGTTNNADLPINVTDHVVTGAASFGHSLFVKTDGTLWAMGENEYGQLGNGTNTGFYIPNPTPVMVASNVVAVAAGSSHSLFVKNDGTLWAVGYNNYGELGNGTGGNYYTTPIKVASNVVAVAAGFAHSLFVKTDGTLWAMGYNRYGQLGSGTNNASQNFSQTTPVSVASNVVAVVAGGNHSLFIKTDETLWAMGDNMYGELGGGTTYEYTNRPIFEANYVVAVAAGYGHSLFVHPDGRLVAMGNDSYGQLGNGTLGTPCPTPMIVASNVLAGAGGYEHSLFVKGDGTLWAMGENEYGQLGVGTTYQYTNLPVIVPHLCVANVFPADQAYHSLAIGLNSTAAGIRLNGSIPTLIFPGIPGNSYSVERSTNLSSWTLLWTTNEPAYGVFQFTDPNAPQPNAYYRLQPFP